jgi:hypothetical protein
VEEVHGAAAAVKAEAGVPWDRIRVLFEEREAREIRRLPDPSPADRASLRLFTYAAKMWNVQLHLVDERFYRELVEAENAREKWYRGTRFAAFAKKPYAENAADWADRIDAMAKGPDKNVEFYRAGKRARHACLLLNAQAILEDALAPEQVAEFKAMRPVIVGMPTLLEAVRRREGVLNVPERKLFRESFGLERRAGQAESGDFNVVKQVALRSFGGSVRRVDHNWNRSGSEQIEIGVAWLLDVVNEFRPGMFV